MTKTFPITIINGKPTCAELPGYELPSFSRYQDNDVDAMAKDTFPPTNSHLDRLDEVDGNAYYRSIWKSGYHKAREKFEFTEDDIRKAMNFGMFGYSGEQKTTIGFIQSLRTPRTPIAIEVEMEPIYADDAFGETYQIGWAPTTNPDGTVKGTYIYE